LKVQYKPVVSAIISKRQKNLCGHRLNLQKQAWKGRDWSDKPCTLHSQYTILAL